MTFSFLALTLPLTFGTPPLPPEPAPAPAPFLHVQVIPPKGAKTTWYPGTPAAASFESPASVALRPGYLYRAELAFETEGKEVKLYPSFEVRGTLQPPRGVDVAKHPVPVVLSDADLSLILRGRFITKYIILESPEKADPIRTNADQLLEYSFPSEKAALDEAREKGRLLMVMRIGERDYARDELAAANVPGTVWLPNIQIPPTPAQPPYLPFGSVLLYDPILGPKYSTEECLADGGDTQKVMGIGPRNRATGIDPSDTAIEFTTAKGSKKVVPSNRVCICVPRFIGLRAETMLALNSVTLSPEGRHQTDMLIRVKNRIFPQDVLKGEMLNGVQVRTRPNGLIGTLGVTAVDQFSGKPMAVAVQNGLKIVADVRELEELNGTDCKMLLTKWVEPRFPEKIGEEVTFFLKYHNATNTTISDVVISDSLTARLEYLTGTSQSDRGATFTTEPNEAGSLMLRWAIDGKLKPGEGGLIRFKARIR